MTRVQCRATIPTVNMSITIYKTDVSPPSRAVLMMAELLKLNYQCQEVNCVTKENMKPEFLKKNPLHTIPVLEDGDLILVDSHVILTYLVSKYGDAKKDELYPSDLALRAIVDQRLFFDATKIFPICKEIIVAILHEMAHEPSKKQIAVAEESYGILETYLQKTKFVACDHLTLADVSIISTMTAMEALVPINEKYEKVHGWLNRLKKEQWYQKANVKGLNLLVELLNNAMERNSS